MRRREFIRAAGVGIALSTTKAWAWDEDANQKKLAELVQAQREKYKLPGMAAAIVRGERHGGRCGDRRAACREA